ncbi:MAG TPA: S26 family signal peptidase [Vitreimonas sp.]|nr:S26 family signal peptidase [Vitreimonas sp.]
MEGHRRRGEDPGRGATGLKPGEPPARGRLRRTWRTALGRARGPWRVEVAEASMLPAVAPGDWLLVDPTVRTWPRRGVLVVVREPDSQQLAIKRVAAGPNARVPFESGYLQLAEDEAWVSADASEEVAAAAGFGPPRDSRRFGPVPLDLLVGRVFFRYGPRGRIGRVR